LYRASVRAAYVAPELQQLVVRSRLAGGRLFNQPSTHIGIERSLGE
jgi:hypothetical protein